MAESPQEDRNEKWYRDGSRWVRYLAVLSTALAGGLAVSAFADKIFYIARSPFPDFISRDAASIIIALLVTIPIAATAFLVESQRIQSGERLEKAEDQFRLHPEKPQFAWDLARKRLENYLDRNLAQAMWIFWLTIIVMAAGFSVVAFGVVKAFEQPTAIAVPIISSASGIIISFLGGSFLLIYRSVVDQTRNYVSVLDRINAVGMAVQVLTTISDAAKELRNQATSTLAKQLLDLYSTPKQ